MLTLLAVPSVFPPENNLLCSPQRRRQCDQKRQGERYVAGGCSFGKNKRQNKCGWLSLGSIAIGNSLPNSNLNPSTDHHHPDCHSHTYREVRLSRSKSVALATSVLPKFDVLSSLRLFFPSIQNVLIFGFEVTRCTVFCRFHTL